VITTFYTWRPRRGAPFGYWNPKEKGMKKNLLVAALALVGLGGCVAVPVYDAGAGYGYGYDYYGPPAATFSFGYTYRDGGYRQGHPHRHYRRHRH
jgi:hypothetical protein